MTKSMGLWASLAFIMVVGAAASVATVNFYSPVGGCDSQVCPTMIPASTTGCCSETNSVCPGDADTACPATCPGDNPNGQVAPATSRAVEEKPVVDEE